MEETVSDRVGGGEEKAWEACSLCPRGCGTDRRRHAGRCGESSVLRIASFGRHFGEEPCFTGSKGSGAFFFSGCPCHCFFCQNAQISQAGGLGRVVSPEQFHEMARRLLAEGAENLNFVTPDPAWPHIETLCRRLRAKGETVPFLFNSSGYHAPALLERALEVCDIFVPDFKFATGALAAEVMGDERYPQIALRSLARMVEAKGFLSPFDASGGTVARQGVLVRHLVLPDHVEESVKVLEVMKREFGRWLPLSVMSQYTPTPAARAKGPPWDREVTPEEYGRVLEAVESLGFENVFIQPLASIPPGPAVVSEEPFLPDFRNEQPFPGNPQSPPWPE